MNGRLRWFAGLALVAAPFLTSACGKSEPSLPDDAGSTADAGARRDTGGVSDGGGRDVSDAGIDLAGADAGEADGGGFVLPPLPESPDKSPTDASRARGFQLYYKERVGRVVLSANRFQMMGDVGWATTTRGARVARTDDEYEVLVGPSDNNKIGTTVWNVYNAYRVFRTRDLELTLIRLLNGLIFYEQVTGHPGMTSREAYPGWTRVVDGDAGTITRTRNGAPVSSPLGYGMNVEFAIIDEFYTGTTFTYRENPEDFLFNLFPGLDPAKYAGTISFIELPKLIRSGECCSSLMRTPDDKQWAGAYWGNHNSRDNFPDLALGYLAAKLAADDASMTADVRGAGSVAVGSGKRIGDLVLANDTSIMTVSNIGTYDTFEISGTIRPHGEPENQDLGSLGACPMAFMAQAMSSEGLNPGAPIPLPGSTDREFFGAPALQNNLNCEIPDEPTCVALDDGYCGRPWGAFAQMELQGQPILDWFDANPALAQALLGSWQNDFDDVTEAAMVVYHYARISGDEGLATQARRAIYDLSVLQAELADRAFGDDESRRARQVLRVGLYQALSDLPTQAAYFGDFLQWDQEAQAAEDALTVGNTQPAALLTDAQIEAQIEARLGNTTLDHVVARYRNAYPDGPPVRRTASGYQARGYPESAWPWRDVEVPRHRSVGSPALLDGIVLCEHAPQWLSCDWAVLGCERPDIDGNGRVDADDVALLDAAQTTFAGQTCADANAWCDMADLDRDGDTDASDLAFVNAANGCWY